LTLCIYIDGFGSENGAAHDNNPTERILLDDYEEGQEEEDDDLLLSSGLKPFDERDHQEIGEGGDSHLKKQQKSKLPFSFLIQNYFKTGGA
jgi:hypothetical protein